LRSSALLRLSLPPEPLPDDSQFFTSCRAIFTSARVHSGKRPPKQARNAGISSRCVVDPDAARDLLHIAPTFFLGEIGDLL